MLVDRQTQAMLRPLLRPYRGLVVAIVGVGICASLAEGIGIGLFIPFLQALDPAQDVVASQTWLGGRLNSLFDSLDPVNRVQKIGAVIFVAIFLKALSTYALAYLFTRLSAAAGHDLRTRIYDAVLTVNFTRLRAVGAGRYLNVLSNESWRTADAMTILVQMVISAITLSIFLALLLLISWQLTLIVAALLLLMAAGLRLLTARIGRLSQKVTRANSEVASKMLDGVGGIEVVRGHGQTDFNRGIFGKVSARLAKVTVRSGALSGLVYPAYEILAALVLLVALLMSAGSIVTLAPLLVFVFLLYRLTPVVKRLESERVELLAAKGAVEESVAVLQQASDTETASGDRPFEKLRDSIVFENVSFRFPASERPALENVSARIASTGLTAIVGRSGAGKSTLVRMLSRFFDPTQGMIKVDGVPLPDLRLDDWRRQIAVVPQTPYLFNTSVRENIAYGAPNADIDEVEAAAKLAGVHDVIVALSDGYETRIGAHGVEFSGGEAQRLCLARAVFRQPQLLLLDEATNALDRISEEQIQNAINDLKGGCAVVVIAHRMQTVASADQILVLEEGKLVQHGTYDELVRKAGQFADLRML